MKGKTLIFFIIFVILSFNSFASDGILGRSDTITPDERSAGELDETIEEYQKQAGESEIQPNIEDQLHELRVKLILEQADSMWDIIIALFKILADTIILLVLLVEMNLILRVITEIIPSIFKKLVDNSANFISRRVKT